MDEHTYESTSVTCNARTAVHTHCYISRYITLHVTLFWMRNNSYRSSRFQIKIKHVVKYVIQQVFKEIIYVKIETPTIHMVGSNRKTCCEWVSTLMIDNGCSNAKDHKRLQCKFPVFRGSELVSFRYKQADMKMKLLALFPSRKKAEEHPREVRCS